MIGLNAGKPAPAAPLNTVKTLIYVRGVFAEVIFSDGPAFVHAVFTGGEVASMFPSERWVVPVCGFKE